jgi:hypothetical protein
VKLKLPVPARFLATDYIHAIFYEKCRERVEISGKGVYTEIKDVMIV